MGNAVKGVERPALGYMGRPFRGHKTNKNKQKHKQNTAKQNDMTHERSKEKIRFGIKCYKK